MYGVLLVLILIAIWIPIFVLYFARDVYVYGKSAVLAFADTGAELRILLPSLFLLLVSIAVWENRRSNRIPIIKGDTAILRVKKPLKKRVQNGALFASVLVILSLPCVCSVFSRYEATESEVVRYNGFNQVLYRFPLESAQAVRVQVQRVGSARTIGRWQLAYQIQFEKESVEFTDFASIDALNELNKQLEGVPKSIEGEEYLTALYEQNSYTDRECRIITALLRS